MKKSTSKDKEKKVVADKGTPKKGSGASDKKSTKSKAKGEASPSGKFHFKIIG